MDARIVHARKAMADLAAQGIHFAPIRHHSPACASATADLIDQVRPAVILIEGPQHFDSLIDDLAHESTAPPVAVLTVRRDGSSRQSSLFPLADFSPEWVALRQAKTLGAECHFIDLDDGARTILNQGQQGQQSERYLAHSRTIAALAAQQGCRDHDELWDHLFEIREDTSELFSEVFVWSALARLDYEPEVLHSEGSLAREACMSRHIARWHEAVDGPIVVVTGAFHTLALVEALANPAPAATDPPRDTGECESWVVPISHADLDGLRGYSAGMPAPSFWQRVWDARRSGAGAQTVPLQFILDVSQLARRLGIDPPLSFAAVQETALQADRLAALRQHRWASRMDVADAISSCLVNEIIDPALRDAVAECNASSVPGRVGSTTGSPPLISETRDTARKLRLIIDDQARHSAVLDVTRSASARTRSRFFHLLDLLGVPFARKVAGPDHVFGIGHAHLTEKWEYQWSPTVEASLSRLLHTGATLAEAGAATIAGKALELLESGRSSAPMAELTVRAALAGLDDEIRQLLGQLGTLIDDDPNLSSVLTTASRLVSLRWAQETAQLGDTADLADLVGRALVQAAYLLPDLALVPRQDEQSAVEDVVRLRRVLRELRAWSGLDTTAIDEALAHLRNQHSVPAVRGSAWAIALTDGELSDNDVMAQLRAYFSPGAIPGAAARFITGLLRTAPELLVRSDDLLRATDEALTSISEDVFMDVLPELRQAFTWLKPLETATVAAKVAAQSGIDPTRLEGISEVSESDLAEAIAIERAVRATLNTAGLSGWVS